ncbi:MAG: CHAD domain-containing protein [Gammaproteobacteria bacterium]
MKHLPGKSLLDQYIKPITRLHVDQTIAGEENTHQIRVSIKRIRAMLVLHEALTGHQPEFAQLDDYLKQLNKALSACRDHDVLLGLLDRIIAKVDQPDVLQLFSSTRTSIAESSLPQLYDVNQVEHMTTDILNAYQALPPIDIRVKNIRNYLKKRLRKTCKNADLLIRQADCIALHSWRKQVKQLYYQAEALRAVSGKSPLPNKTLEKLGERLGDIHDLCVLESTLQQQLASQPQLASPSTWQQSRQLLNKKHASLLKQCKRLYKKACVK